MSSTSPAWTSPTRTSPQVLDLDPAAFKAQLPQVREFLAKFGDDLPAEISAQLEAFEARLEARRDRADQALAAHPQAQEGARGR